VITRRGFVAAAGLLAGGSVLANGGVLTRAGALARGGALACGALPRAGDANAQVASPEAVVAFFDGQLWLDTSGASVAYRAPTGARAMPSFTDEELARARGYI
jgi:hypothetical protein